ncbi:MAG: RNA polymerase sigma factor, partial [Armatimonadota bacterium]|nr:RNA polymerase sigma factor [Armatimonadota bacterium]
DDLTQEVFLRVWTRAEQWDQRGAFKSWLLTIATNLALNHLRSLRRRREQPLELPGDTAEDAQATPAWMIDAGMAGPAESLESAEQQVLLRRLINTLPADKREVFSLSHEADMDTRAISQALGIPEGTVKSRLHYAKKRLTHQWQDIQREHDEQWNDKAPR